MTVQHALPATIGPYSVLDRLGSGGMGVVYLARSPDGDLVAVKVMSPTWTVLPDFPERFHREVSAARRVARFCTAGVLDAALTEECAYLVTEYVAGPTLEELLKNQGPLRGSALESLAVGIAVALNAMHSAGVAHRDLKPSNVLLSPYGPKVIDFGIAQLAETTVSAPTGTVVGTPAYMAPEHARGEAAGPAADIFSWGTVMAHAGTGHPPFGRGTPHDVLYRVIYESPDLLGLDGPLRDLVEWAMAKDPAARPTAAGLLAALVGSPMTVESATRVAQRTWTHRTPLPPEPTGHDTAPPPGRPAAASGGSRHARTKVRRGWVLGAAVVLAVGGVTAGAWAVKPKPATGPLFQDDFRHRTGWAEATTTAGQTGYGPDGYRLVVRPGQGLVPTSPAATARLDDVSITATMRVTGAGGTGVWCRGVPPTLSTDRYDFILTSAGEVAIAKQQADGTSVELAPYRPIVQTGGDVTLSARCHDVPGGVQLDLAVDGSPVARAVDRTDAYGPGSVGLCGYSTTEQTTVDVRAFTVTSASAPGR